MNKSYKKLKFKSILLILIFSFSLGMIMATTEESQMASTLYDMIEGYFATNEMTDTLKSTTYQASLDTTVYYGNIEILIYDGGFEILEDPYKTNLANAHVYPNPCRVYNGDNEIIFTDLTKTAVINIYTLSGNLVNTINKNSNNNKISWNLKNNKGEPAASGVYLYIIKSQGMKNKGKLVIIR